MMEENFKMTDVFTLLNSRKKNQNKGRKATNKKSKKE